MNILKRLNLILLLALVPLLAIGDSLDIEDDIEILTFGSKRGNSFIQTITQKQANKLTELGFTRVELNILKKTKNNLIFINNKIKQGTNWLINVRSYKDNLFFYVFRVDINNKVYKMFPSTQQKGIFYEFNPLRKYVNYNIPKLTYLQVLKQDSRYYFFLSQNNIRLLDKQTVSFISIYNLYNWYKNEGHRTKVQGNKKLKVNYQIELDTIWFKQVYVRKIVVFKD